MHKCYASGVINGASKEITEKSAGAGWAAVDENLSVVVSVEVASGYKDEKRIRVAKSDRR